MGKIIKNNVVYGGVPDEVITAWETEDVQDLSEIEYGDADISDIGDGSITGAIAEHESDISTLNSKTTSRIITSNSSDNDKVTSGSNLNEYIRGGVYIVDSDAIAATISNMPRAASGRLIVVPIFIDGGYYLQQLYIPSTSIDLVYSRRYGSGGSWTPWVKLGNYIVHAGTATTSSAGTAPFSTTYNTNEYACLSVFTTSAVSGYMLLPYKYGDAANGRWGFKALTSAMAAIGSTSVSYVAIMMPYNLNY